ncbi:UDP-N-acetylmuramate dehydrogenase [Sulfuriflexus mobilis]|uniref:UDP-N-acetylmuramate dehydrogenase n=1 Tax=Sulfuriflexus mobilis TaxID=1811807 RepID=UPI003B8497BD
MAAEQQTALRGELLHKEPMARHTSWRVGGPADCYYRPADIDDLAAFLQQLPLDEPLTWMGLGSNLLVRDGGIRGTVIATSGLLNDLSREQGQRLRAEAGVSCAKLARFAAREGLTGAEFFAGIPGTVGGALAMNAGAFGGETWPLVVGVETLDRYGQRHVRSAAEYTVAYRSVKGPAEEWFVAATLQLANGDIEAAQRRIKALLAKRGATQPTTQPSCGSVFRNPQGGHAAQLIEQCGLKGKCIGGACVSEKHANFIINTGAATARNIEGLIEEVAATVLRECGVSLVREVHIIGEAG